MARFIGTGGVLPTVAAPFDSGARESELADRLTGLIFSDKSGNLLIDQSIDGTNWDVTQTLAVVGGTGQGFSVELLAPYYRVRFVPSADTTVFRLAARLASAGAR